MKWNEISNPQDLEDLLKVHSVLPLFKHSSRCSISSMAKNRLERNDALPFEEVYLIDVIKNRELSNYIAEKFDVTHESPQMIVLKEGSVVYHGSHSGIDITTISATI